MNTDENSLESVTDITDALAGIRFCDLNASHDEDQTMQFTQPRWAASINTSLGHASGRLPSHRGECWQAWHWCGERIPESDLPRSETWNRLKSRAHILCRTPLLVTGRLCTDSESPPHNPTSTAGVHA